MSPKTLPPSTYDSPIHDVGIHQSHNSLLVPRAPDGKKMDRRLWGMKQLDIDIIQQDEWLHWGELPEHVAAVRSNMSRPQVWFPERA